MLSASKNTTATHQMTKEEWRKICSDLTDAMLSFTRPFVTSLGTPTANKDRLAGSGTYVGLAGQRLLLTCEHVARFQPIDHYFSGTQTRFEHPGLWCSDPHPKKDVAFAFITDAVWLSEQHRSLPLPYAKIAEQHHIAFPEELLFFRGYAGENSKYDDGVLTTNGTGYCSQEVKGSGDSQIFEIFWDPANTGYSKLTTHSSHADHLR